MNPKIRQKVLIQSQPYPVINFVTRSQTHSDKIWDIWFAGLRISESKTSSQINEKEAQRKKYIIKKEKPTSGLQCVADIKIEQKIKWYYGKQPSPLPSSFSTFDSSLKFLKVGIDEFLAMLENDLTVNLTPSCTQTKKNVKRGIVMLYSKP